MKKILTFISALTVSIILLLTSVLAASAASSSAPTPKFSDVPTTQTYHSGIEFLAAQGIIGGYPDGTYKPKNTLNRAEMMKIIIEARIDKSNATALQQLNAFSTAKCFSDVKPNQWFTKYICYAQSQGWVKGYDNGKNFRPTQTVSFVEALKITLKAFNITFEEEKDIWYRQMVKKAGEKNLIPFTIKSFHAGLQRDQMADLVTRILKEKSGGLEKYLGQRADLQANYDTIDKGLDLSSLSRETVCAQGVTCP